jgi:Domain of unknown function (DUF4468) with TBP-like fold
MRFFCLIILLVGLQSASFAQKQAVDAGSFSFNEIVSADSAAKGFLYHNALLWLKQNPGRLTNEIVVKDSLEGKLSGSASFLVYSQSGVLMKLSGRVSYDFLIETKDSKYRFALNNFIFHYYQQDRTYNMVETQRTKSLAEPKAPGWQKLWDQHRGNTIKKMKAAIADLKVKIIYKGEKPKEGEKKVEW